MGGFSAEREISLQSGAGIAEALRRKGYEVTTHDLSDTRQLLAELGRSKPDVVFNALHGNWGEDGTVPALLDLLQIPYTHSGMQASCVGMNKYLCRLNAKYEHWVNDIYDGEVLLVDKDTEDFVENPAVLEKICRRIDRLRNEQKR